MNRRLVFFTLLIVTLATVQLSSCKKFEGSQTVPAYIRIDTVGVTCDYTVYGANTHKFIDAWVYVDDNIVGCYELPTVFPVLKEGKHKVAIYPGIARDGIRDLRVDYPFMAPWEDTVDFVMAEAVTLKPMFHYYPVGVDASMHICEDLMEDFEDGTIQFETTETSDAEIELVNDGPVMPNHEGDGSTYRCAKLVLNSESESFRMVTSNELKGLPTTGKACMLEMDYKCSDTCQVGLIYSTNPYGESIVRLRPTDESGKEPTKWNKIYINIGPYLVDNETSEYFKVYFSSWEPRNGGTQYFYFDNLKLIYRDR